MEDSQTEVLKTTVDFPHNTKNTEQNIVLDPSKL